MNTETRTDFERLTEALDISELPVEEQEEILLDVQDVILKGTFVRILEKMTDEQQDAFTQFVETGPSGEEFLAYVSENVPDADEIVSETIEEFARDILAVTKE